MGRMHRMFAAVAMACLGLAAEAEPPSDGPAVVPPAEQALLHVVTAFVAVETGLPVPRELPSIRIVNDADRTRHALDGGAKLAGEYAILALYDPRSRVIYLPEGWTGATPAELSVLVHEMTHDLQTAAGLRFACAAEAEKAAYASQARFLALFGRELETEFALDPMFLMVATTCLP